MDQPSYDEAVYMVKIKRRRAKEAMARIVESNGVISTVDPMPGMEVLLNYFTNMIYGLELLLKVLARDWDGPTKTKFVHKVGQMYEAVFKRKHPDAAFMKELKDAIIDQKFIFEPAKGLMNRVGDIEALWDELKAEYAKQAWGKMSEVQKDVKSNAAFGEYLMQNVGRFIPVPTYRYNRMTTAQKVALKRAHIQNIQREIDRLESQGEPQMTDDELVAKLRQEHVEKIERLTSMMAHRFELAGTSEIDFMVWTAGMAWQDLGKERGTADQQWPARALLRAGRSPSTSGWADVQVTARK